MLYIVSTPIGNLKDMTFRAVEVLKSVDLIAAEDTRHTKILCGRYGIDTPTTSFFEHNQLKKSDELIKFIQGGKSVALVTDAGTPGISDPGYPLIKAAREHNIPVTVIPGPTAFVAALTLSGLPSHEFVFEGFLPVKSGARRKKIESFKREDKTVIFYESVHRLLKTLKDIEVVLNNPSVVVARELTKKFEEVLENKAAILIEHFIKTPPKGEFVLLLKL